MPGKRFICFLWLSIPGMSMWDLSTTLCTSLFFLSHSSAMSPK